MMIKLQRFRFILFFVPSAMIQQKKVYTMSGHSHYSICRSLTIISVLMILIVFQLFDSNKQNRKNILSITSYGAEMINNVIIDEMVDVLRSDFRHFL